MVVLLASMTRSILFNILAGIREELLQSRAFPDCVIQTLVAFAVALPSAMCTVHAPVQ